MKALSKRVAAGFCLLVTLFLLALRAEEPAKKTESVKPPWQRLLTGENAKKADEQEKELAQLQEAGKLDEALKVAELLTAFRARVQGADHWEAVNARWEVAALRYASKQKEEIRKQYAGISTLVQQTRALESRGRYKEAQPLQEKILALRLRVLGEDHPDTGASYNNLALNLNAQGKYAEAEKRFQKALSIRRKILDEEHPISATVYEGIAANLYAQGKYADSAKFFRKSLSIRLKVLGEEDPNTALTYNNLANNSIRQGKHAEAEESLRKALAIFRKILGEEHSYTAVSYNNLASTLQAQGKYREAEENYRKALAIYCKVLGEDSPDTAIGYNNLATNLYFQSKYAEAEETYRKALTIKRKVDGEEHPNTAASYNNLAANLDAQGKYREAEEIYRKALAIRRKILGEEHPDTIISSQSVAHNLSAQGKYQEAEEICRKALALRRKMLGEEHPDTANSYNNLASNQNAQGKHAQAEEGFRKSLTIRRKVLGEEHPDTATSYNNLAHSQNAQGKSREAEEDYRKALAIRCKVLGEEHSDTAASYTNLGSNQNDQGKYAEAEALWRSAAQAFAKARFHIAGTGLERAAKTSERSPLPSLAAVLARNGKAEEAWQRFEESLARGTLDDFTARLRRPQAERDKQAQIISRIDRLQKLIEATNAAKLTTEQTKQRDERFTQLRQAYDELAAFIQELEKKYGPVAGEIFSRATIQKSLPGDAVLLGWLDIPGRPKARDPNGEHWAILLRSTGKPIWVRLSGSGDKGAWTDADTHLPAKLREVVQSSRVLWQPLAERLRQQRLDPLVQHLKDVRQLIVLPSTAMAGAPLEIIADSYTVSYAHSSTMYAYLHQQKAPTGKGLLVLADPVFDPPMEKESSPPLPPSGVLLTIVLPGSNAARAGLKPNDVLLRYGDSDLAKPTDFKALPPSDDPDQSVPVIVWRDGQKRKQPFYVRPGKLGVVIAQEPAPQALAEQRRWDRKLASALRGDWGWNRLPGTRIEAASLHHLFDKDTPVTILLDSDASEQRLNEVAASGELGKYRYIHLATHGEVDNVMPLRSAVILSRDQLPDKKQRTELLLSGQPIPDGRVTADEALRHWKLQSDLVTLSACHTALGKYERGEGYVGFAQALILCGTRSVCLSLWKVDDVATALLMERFYQNLLGKRDGLKAPMPKAAALAEAKSWLRTLPRAEAEKRAASMMEGMSRGKNAPKPPSLQVPPAAAKANAGDCPFAHPRYWAAFVLVGQAD